MLEESLSFLNEHPTIKNVTELIIVSALTLVVLIVILHLEKKATKKMGIFKTSINMRYAEIIFRFIIIFIAVQWVVLSSPLTRPFGKILFQGSALIVAIAGFAAQPVISDLICGLMISITKPFDIGDRIELENGTSGIVKDITLHHVVIQTIDTLQMIVPNSKLSSMMLQNMSYRTTVRSLHFRFNVSYDTDVKEAMAVIFNAVKASPYSIPGKKGKSGQQEYGDVYFFSFSESSLVLVVTVYFEPTHPSEVVKSDINLRVKNALNAAGIEIPYNYVNVVLGGKEPETEEENEKKQA